jgi:hypothetical protein
MIDHVSLGVSDALRSSKLHATPDATPSTWK